MKFAKQIQAGSFILILLMAILETAIHSAVHHDHGHDHAEQCEDHDHGDERENSICSHEHQCELCVIIQANSNFLPHAESESNFTIQNTLTTDFPSGFVAAEGSSAFCPRGPPRI